MSIEDRNRIIELERRVAALENKAAAEKALTEVMDQQLREARTQTRETLKVRRG